MATAALWIALAGCSQPSPTVNPVEPISLHAMQAMLADSQFSGLAAVMASWCPPCREELPVLAKFYDKYRDRGIRVLAISIDTDGASVVQPLINELEIPYPVFWVGTEAGRHYKIRGVPTLLVIRNGVIQQKIAGRLSYGAIEAIVQEILSAPADPNAV